MKYPINNMECYIADYLPPILDTVAYNIPNDWDIVMLVTGDRMVRVGKSVFSQNSIAGYLAYRLGIPFTVDNIYFDSKEMIKKAMATKKTDIFLYDEGREGLSNMQKTQWQKDLLDYFAQCGQLNHIFIIVIDDFFALPEQMAIGRSEYLFNVYRTEEKVFRKLYKDDIDRPVVRWERGNVQFFNRSDKKYLYDQARIKKTKDYTLIRASCPPLHFTNTYIIDEKAYRIKKKEYLSKVTKRIDDVKISKTDIIRDKIILDMYNNGENSIDIQKYLIKRFNYEITDRYVRNIILNHKKKEENTLENEDLEGNAEQSLLEKHDVNTKIIEEVPEVESNGK